MTEQRVLWRDTASSTVLELDYPSILMHAVCRDAESVPEPCVYCQLLVQGADAADAPVGDESDEERCSEARFVPPSADSVDDVFRAMSACAALHPDADSGMDDDADSDGGWAVGAGASGSRASVHGGCG